MSKQRLASRDRSSTEVIPIDPLTGLTPGTAAQPLITQTSTLQTTSDLTTIKVGPITAVTGSTAIVAASPGNRIRVYRMRMNIGAANVVTILDGATVLERLNFAGAGFLTYDFNTRPWWIGTVNTALNYTTTTTGELNLILEYTLVP